MESRKEVKKVSDTAKPVLAAKYFTSQPSFWKSRQCGNRETPLSHNEAVKIFLSSDDLEQVEKRPDINNIKTVSVRERWINKLFEKYVKEHKYQQVVILGSGFDIRAHKKNQQNQANKKNASVYSQVKFWEIDKAEILDEKEKAFQVNNVDKNATYIKADYTKSDFISLLVNDGLDINMPTLVIFEGNIMYLELDKVKAVFKDLNSSLHEFVVAFDYFPQTLIDMIAARAKDGLNEGLWKTGINDLQDFATQSGLTVVERRSIGDLSKEYDVDNNPSPGANQYSVCALRK